ncbi:MAG: hypothetical protein ACJA0Q_000885 [Saprospiraceae bacterium]|jgi:hypothetical protein
MRLIAIILLIVFPICSQAGKAFLGKGSQFSFNITDAVVKRKLNLEYTKFFSRSYGLSIEGAYVNDKAELNDGVSFSYLKKLTTSNSSYIAMDGGEIFIRFMRGNGFENNVIPIGYTVSLGIGLTQYNISENYYGQQLQQSFTGPTVNSDSRITLIYEVGLKRTYNLYKAVNFFIGANGGLLNVLSKDDNLLYALPKRGLNSAYSTSNFAGRLYLNLSLGVAIML